MSVTKGNYSITGPRCHLTMADGIRSGRCWDGGSESLQPGGSTQVFPCWPQWYQFLSFGDGEHTPLGSMHLTIPDHVVKQINRLGHSQDPYMCLGVYGRGDKDELDWHDEEYIARKQGSASDTDSEQLEDEGVAPLSEWAGDEVITTQCSNVKAVIEWVFVPFIVENEEEDNNAATDEL